MDISSELMIFFIVTSILGIVMALFFSIDGLSEKFYKFFEEDRDKKH